MKKSFNENWEKKIYSKGNHLNEYPFSILVSLIARKFYKIPFDERKNLKILDLGCGAGNNSKFIAEKGFSLFGIDGSQSSISFCKKLFNKKSLDGEFVCGDFINMPYEDNFFDCVIDRESIYANSRDNVKKIIDEVNRVLKFQGIFISFMYSESHPNIKYGKKISEGTYDNFKDGSFKNAGIAHFIEMDMIKKFFHSFRIKNVMRHSLKECYNQKTENGTFDEYIIIAEKKESKE